MKDFFLSALFVAVAATMPAHADFNSDVNDQVAQWERENQQQKESQAKALYDLEVKAKAMQEYYKKHPTTKRDSSDVDDLLGGLGNGKNAPVKQPKDATRDNGVDVSTYVNQVVTAFQRSFYDADLYKGKRCNLRVSLNINGELQSVKSEGGDPALCTASITAIKAAKFPKMYSPELLPIFKDAPLIVAPQ
ncbi:cell envelope integrity protein TolA [Pantoea agglomerans]|uniref:cell envelope integrity protein TolA n=1 Tax=Enterobacter agglomerans TaxID=549 RepID=UPI0032082D45